MFGDTHLSAFLMQCKLILSLEHGKMDFNQDSTMQYCLILLFLLVKIYIMFSLFDDDGFNF